MAFDETNYGVVQEKSETMTEQAELRTFSSALDAVKHQVLLENPEEDPEVKELLDDIENKKGELNTARKAVLSYITTWSGEFTLKQLRSHESIAAALSGQYRQLLWKYKEMIESITKETLDEIIDDVQDNNSYAYHNYDSLSPEEKEAGTREDFEQIYLESKKTQELYEKERQILLLELDADLDEAMVEQRQFEYDKLQAKKTAKVDTVWKKDIVEAEQKLAKAQDWVIATQQKIDKLNAVVKKLEEVDAAGIISVQNQLQKEKSPSSTSTLGGWQKMTNRARWRLQRMQKLKRTKCRRCRGPREFGKT